MPRSPPPSASAGASPTTSSASPSGSKTPATCSRICDKRWRPSEAAAKRPASAPPTLNTTVLACRWSDEGQEEPGKEYIGHAAKEGERRKGDDTRRARVMGDLSAGEPGAGGEADVCPARP